MINKEKSHSLNTELEVRGWAGVQELASEKEKERAQSVLEGQEKSGINEAGEGG